VRLPLVELVDRCAGVDPVALDTAGVQALVSTQRMQQGLPPMTQVVWRELAATFPRLTGLGAWGDRSHQARTSCHNLNTPAGPRTGPRAIDAMTTDRALGDAVVKWALLHRDRLDITVIIWWGQIWSARGNWKPRRYVGRSAHKDHVHLSIGCQG
jgi:hypothetical protein